MKTIQDLEREENKISIFCDWEQFTQYIVTLKDLIDAFDTCLTDEQKLEVMTKSDYFNRLKSNVKTRIIMTIKEDAIKSQIIRDLPLIESTFEKYNFMNFLENVAPEDQIYVLNQPDLLKKLGIARYEIRTIIESMPNEKREELLSNKEFIEQQNFYKSDVIQLITGLENDNKKIELAKQYGYNRSDTVEIMSSFSTENKKREILKDNNGLQNKEAINLIASFDTQDLINFMNEQQQFLTDRDIEPYQIFLKMLPEEQLEVFERMEEMQLTERDKRRVFATLRNETKQKIDLDKVDEKYRFFISLKLSEDIMEYGKVIPDFSQDISQYADLNELLSINPLQMVKSDEDRQKMLELCQICPDIRIRDNLMLGSSTAEEYIKGEEWVSSVLQGIQEDWTDVQKLAHIDTAIGKKISYSPEFGTEAEKSEDARALWKIISSGYGVCNGIAQIEKCLLERVRIEAEIVSAKTHAYVKVNNIEIPTENGIIKGDTLVDPTWNLTASRYGSRPHHFCKSYEELRKFDIDSKGVDHNCHKNDEVAKQQTIEIDEKSLREVYKRIGITEKDGTFPIGRLMEQARKIDETATDIQSNINSKFALLKEWCPEFATCQNSTIDAIRDILFQHNEKFDFKRCIASRVYDRQDKEKNAILYVYMELQDNEKQFFCADKELGEFIQMSKQEFERKFECYEADMKKLPGHRRPWETNVEIEEKKENSSGEIVAEEGR